MRSANTDYFSIRASGLGGHLEDFSTSMQPSPLLLPFTLSTLRTRSCQGNRVTLARNKRMLYIVQKVYGVPEYTDTILQVS